jgi:uncharacterized protein (TIGR03083 family)
MNLDGYLAEGQRGTDLILDTAAGRLGDQVPSCPDWTLADLAFHVSAFFGMWVEAASEGFDPASSKRSPRPPDDELLASLRDVSTAAIDALRRLGDLDAPLWNWSGDDQTVGWVARRIAAEIAIHARDAEGVVSVPGAVPTDVAIEGVQEFFEAFAPMLAGGLDIEPMTVHLHATDGPDGAGEWLVRIAKGSVEVEHGHAKGDVAVRAPASDLFLLCWGRCDLADLEVFGAAAELRSVLEAMRI